MMFKIGKKVKETVGLDIGSHSIKVVSVIRKTDKNLLTSYNIKKIPVGDTKSVKTGKLIKEAFSEVDIRPSEVNLSISGSNVIVRFITMPKMSREQLENAMLFEAERYIPFSVSEVILDFAILDPAESGQMNVLLAAAKKDFVQTQIELLEKLGISVNVIDINVFSVFNAFLSFNSMAADKGSVFLDFGHSQTSMLISTGEVPRFMRLIQIGGKDITAAISEEMGVTPEEAEELKQKKDDPNKAKVMQVTSGVLDELIKEMQLSFSYFESKCNKPIGDIFCSGGMIYQQGIMEYFKEKMGVQFKTWNPAGGMEIAETLSKEAIDAGAAQLAVGVGLSLRE